MNRHRSLATKQNEIFFFSPRGASIKNCWRQKKRCMYNTIKQQLFMAFSPLSRGCRTSFHSPTGLAGANKKMVSVLGRYVHSFWQMRYTHNLSRIIIKHTRETCSAHTKLFFLMIVKNNGNNISPQLGFSLKIPLAFSLMTSENVWTWLHGSADSPEF